MDKLPSVTMVMTQPYFTVSESSLLINPSMTHHFVSYCICICYN